MYRGRMVSVDTYDSYSDRDRDERVILVHQQNPPPRRQSDTIRTYTTSPTNAYSPLPHGMRPLVDTSQPRTTLRITLYTGQNTTLDLNLSHTVADIHTYVMSVAPTAGSYQLLSGYPPRPLADPSATIKSAKLQNANVQMRLA